MIPGTPSYDQVLQSYFAASGSRPLKTPSRSSVSRKPSSTSVAALV
jgi:hypothetical protein